MPTHQQYFFVNQTAAGSFASDTQTKIVQTVRDVTYTKTLGLFDSDVVGYCTFVWPNNDTDEMFFHPGAGVATVEFLVNLVGTLIASYALVVAARGHSQKVKTSDLAGTAAAASLIGLFGSGTRRVNDAFTVFHYLQDGRNFHTAGYYTYSEGSLQLNGKLKKSQLLDRIS